MAFGQNTATIRSTPSQNGPRSTLRHRFLPEIIGGPRILFMLAVMALVLFGLVMVFRHPPSKLSAKESRRRRS